MSRLFYLLIAVLFYSPLFGQSRTPIIINDNLVHNNYRQENIALFPDSSNGFIVRWSDLRFGSALTYTQEYTETLEKIGEKKSTKFYDLINYSHHNNSFGIYSETYQAWIDMGSISFLGNLFSDKFTSEDPIYLGGGLMPWCGTGWPGEGTNIDRYMDEFVVANDYGGEIQLTKIYSDGTDSIVNRINGHDPEYGSSANIAANSIGEYCLTFLNMTNYDSIGISIQTYSNTDSLINSKLIKVLHGDHYEWGLRLQSELLSVSDTLFQYFYIDSLKLNTFTFDTKGNIKRENKYSIFYRNDYPDYYFYEEMITCSNFNEENYALIVQIEEGRNDYSNSLFYFDKNGELLSQYFDRELNYDIGDEIFKDEDGRLTIPRIIDKKAYLMKYDNFTKIDSALISDEEAKTNENRPRIVEYTGDQLFITYRNEIRTASRVLSSEGNPISEEKEIDAQNYQFFSDGTSMRTFIVKVGSGLVSAGYRLYDENLNLTKTDTLVKGIDDDYGTCLGTINQNDEFVLIYQNSEGPFVAKYNKEGEELLNTKLAETPVKYGTSGRIFFDGEKTFTYYKNRIYTLDNEFNIMNQSSEVYSIFAYLGNDRFVNSLSSYEESKYYSQILNSNGDTLVSDITLMAPRVETLRVVGYANKDQFIHFYLRDNKLIATTYNSLGEVVVGNFVVYAFEDEIVKDITFLADAEKILFAWAGKKIGEHDFDIYTVSYNLDKLTDFEDVYKEVLPIEFALSQNYPNPFNPTTKISYSIPNQSYISLKVFDVLGREVTELINQEQSAGSYEVQFNASNLGSGVYFYKLSSRTFVESKKMILLK